MTDDSSHVRHVPARDIPVPTHLSPEAQAMLSLPPLGEAPESPSLDDKEGWWARTAVQDEMVLAALAPRAAKIAVDVEGLVVDGVPDLVITPRGTAAVDPRDVIVGGSSAGGNLAAALILRARDEGLPLPAAAVLLTPEVDLTESGDSFHTNLGLDSVLTARLMPTNLLYADGHDLAHPYLSPLFGDFTKGFPPTFLQAGTRDLFLSNAVRMHVALREAGVPADLYVLEGAPHGGFFGTAPEDDQLDRVVRRFVDEHWRT